MSEALTVVQSAYACFGRGDVPGLLALLAEDVSWKFVGDRATRYTGHFQGRARIGEWFGLVAQADDIQAFEPREFLAAPDHVTVLGYERTAAKPGGKIFETEWVHVWKVRGAHVTHFFGIFDTEAAAKARG